MNKFKARKSNYCLGFKASLSCKAYKLTSHFHLFWFLLINFAHTDVQYFMLIGFWAILFHWVICMFYQWLDDYVNVSIMFFEIFQCFETSICNFIDRNVTIVDVQMSEFK